MTDGAESARPYRMGRQAKPNRVYALQLVDYASIELRLLALCGHEDPYIQALLARNDDPPTGKDETEPSTDAD